VIAGIEANIARDGSLDLHPDEVARFEIVLAAPHSALRKSEDQTARMLAAVRQPGIHVLAHPRGRMLTRRGLRARWEDVFAEAARLGVAVELDGDPWRQDLDHALARVALEAGCLFALDSDAHAGDQLFYSEFALAHARLAGIPAERVVNAWPAERLLAWARDRASPSNRPRPSVKSRAEATAGR
jgi:putative hydrolase